MDNMLEESKWLYKNLLNEKQRQMIDGTILKLQDGIEEHLLSPLWEIDEEIGGIGGYNMPKNPLDNPFPGGIEREFFRPLQYAACELERGITYSCRYVVHYSGMHLEAVSRQYIINQQTLGTLRNFNSTLGKATHKISSLRKLDPMVIEGMFKFVTLYNFSKHDVNQDDSRKRLFYPEDALVAYIAARKIGRYLFSNT